MKASRPYARLMTQVIGHIAQANSEYQHPFLVERARSQARRLHRRVDRPRPVPAASTTTCSASCSARSASGRSKGVEVDVVTHRPEGSAFFRRLKVNMVGSVTHLGDKPQHRAAGRRDQGDARRLQRRHGRPRVPRLQRLRQHDDAEARRSTSCCRCRPSERRSRTHDWDYIYEPDAEDRARARADALHRVAGVPGGAREPRVRTRRAHGRDEGARRDNATKLIGTLQPGLQQGAPGGDHAGNLRNRRRRRGGLNRHADAHARPTAAFRVTRGNRP